MSRTSWLLGVMYTTCKCSINGRLLGYMMEMILRGYQMDIRCSECIDVVMSCISVGEQRRTRKCQGRATRAICFPLKQLNSTQLNQVLTPQLLLQHLQLSKQIWKIVKPRIYIMASNSVCTSCLRALRQSGKKEMRVSLESLSTTSV